MLIDMQESAKLDAVPQNIFILVSFVGNHDPFADDADNPGPILSFLLKRHIDKAYLLCSSGSYLERVKELEQIAASEGILAEIVPIDFALTDVIDYDAIYTKLKHVLSRVFTENNLPQKSKLAVEYFFLLDSGTPQMKTCLFIEGLLNEKTIKMFQGIPPRFTGGIYETREIKREAISFYRSLSSIGSLPAATVSNSRPQLFQIPEKAMQAARYNEPVLLIGETGTGKTVTARYIHEHSNRCNKPFIEINCSAIPESLAESELFGHIRGSFSGAEKSRSGKFRAAEGGTLFLDEIGELSLDIQAKILKAIEEKTITPLGSDEPVTISSVRLIAATNKNLKEAIKTGKFRQDLYERLKVLVLDLPPLRSMPEKILPLAQQFLQDWNQEYGEQKYFSTEVLECFTKYNWPGNIRELKNTVRSAACTEQGNCISVSALPYELELSGSNRESGQAEQAATTLQYIPTIQLQPGGINLKARLLQIEWEYVVQALRLANNNREQAARLLGMTGHAFRKALRERLAGFLSEELDENE